MHANRTCTKISWTLDYRTEAEEAAAAAAAAPPAVALGDDTPDLSTVSFQNFMFVFAA